MTYEGGPFSDEFELSDGSYLVDVTMDGGSGRATIKSPAELNKSNDNTFIKIEWSSPNFDYMKLNGNVYNAANTSGNSVFEIPVPVLDEPFEVIADTTAMSTPHEISYMLTLDSKSITPVRQKHQSGVWIIGLVIVAGVLIAIAHNQRKKRNDIS